MRLRSFVPFRAAQGPHRRRFHRPLRLEILEARETPSAGLLSSLAMPPLDVVATPMAYRADYALTPALVRTAYGFDQVYVGDGGGGGRGQTIAIVTAYDHPTIERDLRQFNQAFGLPDAPSFRKVTQEGAKANPVWAAETALDVQWAHAAAPQAGILLVQARSASLYDLLQAVDFARHQPDVSVVSMSWGTGEFASQAAWDWVFTTPFGHQGVTFVAAAGDLGGQVAWPAVSSNVLSVGGTQLTIDGQGNYVAESAWSNSGGGFSATVGAPFYQDAYYTGRTRAVPDVAYAADPGSGFLVYNSVPNAQNKSGWFKMGGTSAGAPQWAGIVAVANAQRAAAGLPRINSAQSVVSSLTSDAFNDVTEGSNGYSASRGFDLATGRGTPKVGVVVSQLVGTQNVETTELVGPRPRPSDPRVQVQLDDTSTAALAMAFAPIMPNFFLSRGFSTGNEVTTSRDLEPRADAPAAVQPAVPPGATPFTVDLSRRGGGRSEEQYLAENPGIATVTPNSTPAAPTTPGGTTTPSTPAPSAPPAPPAANASSDSGVTAVAEIPKQAEATPRSEARPIFNAWPIVLGLTGLVGGYFFDTQSERKKIGVRRRWLKKVD